jgi:hypothetical protein
MKSRDSRSRYINRTIEQHADCGKPRARRASQFTRKAKLVCGRRAGKALKPGACVADGSGVTKSAYYGYFVMWAVPPAFTAFAFLAIALDLSAAAVSFAYFVIGGVFAVEGLLLVTDWRGGRSFFTRLRSQADLSPAARLATWMPNWWPWSFDASVRVSGGITVAGGALILLLGLALLLS